MGLRLLHGAPVLGSRLQEPVRLGSPAPSLNSWSAKHCARSLNCTACSYLLYYYDGTRLACLAVGTLDFAAAWGGGLPSRHGVSGMLPPSLRPRSPIYYPPDKPTRARQGDLHLYKEGRCPGPPGSSWPHNKLMPTAQTAVPGFLYIPTKPPKG